MKKCKRRGYICLVNGSKYRANRWRRVLEMIINVPRGVCTQDDSALPPWLVLQIQKKFSFNPLKTSFEVIQGTVRQLLLAEG